MADADFENFFGSSSAFLGVPYPANSSEYNNSGNFGFGVTDNGHWAVKGRRAPIVSDPYTHYAIPVGTGGTITRGRNALPGSIVWSQTLVAIGMTSANSFWQNPVDDSLYVIGNDTSNFVAIKKLTLAAGAATTPFQGALFNPFPNFGIQTWHAAPRDVANPDTSIWDIVGDAGTASSSVLKQLKATAGVHTETLTAIVVDSGGTPQTVGTPIQYVTADRKIILGNWKSIFDTTGRRFISFVIMRDSVRQFISIPYDGNLPFAEGTIPDLHNYQGIDGTVSGTVENLGIEVYGSSVLFSTDSITTKPWIIGKRLFNRVSFDRWLTAICNAMKMPPGVEYYSL